MEWQVALQLAHDWSGQRGRGFWHYSPHPSSLREETAQGEDDWQTKTYYTKPTQECIEVPLDFDSQSAGPGQCLWRELTPLSGTFSAMSPALYLTRPPSYPERDHKYDRYLNSQECLSNPAASFLLKYKWVEIKMKVQFILDSRWKGKLFKNDKRSI